MSLRLRTLKRNIASAIQSSDKKKDVEAAIDEMANLLPSFADQAFETFFVDQVSRISGDIHKNVEASMKDVLRLHEFSKLLARSNVKSLKDLPTTKPLKQLFADFTAKASPVGAIDDLVGTVSTMASSTQVQDIDMPDPHVYLKDIELLDEAGLAGEQVSIKSVTTKLMGVISVSLPLLEAAGFADQKEAQSSRIGKQASNVSAIEGILNMVTGDQAKLHTRRIYRATKLIRDVSNRAKDIEAERNMLKARHDKPWMYMIQKDQQLPEDKYKEQMDWFESEIAAAKKKLKHVLGVFSNSAERAELVDSLQKLNKHVDVNIVGALNSAIARIRAAGVKTVVLSKTDLEKALAAGIKVESVLATSESPIKDLESINHEFFKAKEQVHVMLTSLLGKISKRANEERAIVENGIFEALERILKQYESNQRGMSGSGFLCMANLVRDMEIDLLDSLSREIKRLALLLSERNVDAIAVKALLDAMNVPSVENIDVDVLDAILDERKLPGVAFDAGMRLLRYTPLTKEAYFEGKIAATREQIARIAAELKMFESVLHVLVDLGRRIEELDPFLPRKFMAITDFRTPTSFAGIIDTWYNENLGRLFVAGGADKQREITTKMAAVKAKLSSLEGMLTAIPPELVSKMRSLPLPACS